MQPRTVVSILIGLVIVVWIGLGVGIGIYTDWMWFESLGFFSVYSTMLGSKIATFVAFSAIAFVILGINVYLARRMGEQTRGISFEVVGEGPMDVPTRPRHAYLFWLIGTGVFAMLIGLAAPPQWQVVLRWLHRTPFGTKDPLFARDVGFYVFSLPFYRFVQGWLLFTLFLATLVTGMSYYRDRSIQSTGKGLWLAAWVKAHLSAIGGAIFLVIAWRYRLKMFELLYSTRGVVFGAGYTDMHAQLPAYWILLIASLGCAVGLFVNIRYKGWRIPAWGVGSVVGLSILVSGILPGIVQQVVVKPNEIAKEEQYIRHNITYTRKAYRLDTIVERDFPAMETITMDVLERNRTTVRNIRLWDRPPLMQTYAQLQEIRLYYKFRNIDDDRYRFDGEYRQVTVSARELSAAQLPLDTWLNRHLGYTHGYGVCMSPVNEITPEGLPDLFVKDIPPISKVGIEIVRPEIYYGEETRDYVIVNTEAKEFDYPKGDENVYATYRGRGGIRLSSFLRRVAFAWKFGHLKILLTRYVTDDSRIMLYRQIDQRQRTVAPFLRYDKDPYIAISGGKLYWIQDAYTTTEMYPYSEPIRKGYRRDLNYIRNSVKVIIDAYHGSLTFYVVDEDDPLIRTYRKIFPELFRPFDEMPEELKAHIRYPSDLFAIQASLYSTYHMNDPQVFYNREDLWHFPEEIYEDTSHQMPPYYIIMRLPDAEREEFLLMLPFTPAKKNNMIAWMSARCDFPGYGELMVYKLPKKKLIYGPMQIEARIDQDAEISKEMTLWGQKGSKVIRGNLLVIPIEQSFLYVEPIYLQAMQGELPELKRVLAAHGDVLAMRPTLRDALEAIFGRVERIVQEEPSEGWDSSALASTALSEYRRAQELLKAGDWAGYGEALKRLERTLEDLSRALE